MKLLILSIKRHRIYTTPDTLLLQGNYSKFEKPHTSTDDRAVKFLLDEALMAGCSGSTAIFHIEILCLVSFFDTYNGTACSWSRTKVVNDTVHLLRNLYIGLVPLYLWICRILKRLRYENLQILSLRTQCSLEIFIYTSPPMFLASCIKITSAL